MYWTDFKKTFTLALGLSITLFYSCSNESKNTQDGVVENEKEVIVASKEERIARMVENELNIPATEKYDIEILYKYIDPDTLEDALILVNRRDHAFKHVKENGNERFFEKTGYTGLFNYIFVLLGDSKKLISTTPVGSNVNKTLKAEFLELTSKAFTDFYVDYRIQNSMQRNYYTVRRNEIFLTFSCPIFDSIGQPNPIVYDIQHKESTVRLTKDIALYHASFVDYNPEDIEDITAYEPKGIKSSDDLYVYFIFDDKKMKYVTPMAAPEE